MPGRSHAKVLHAKTSAPIVKIGIQSRTINDYRSYSRSMLSVFIGKHDAAVEPALVIFNPVISEIDFFEKACVDDTDYRLPTGRIYVG